jgi:hypothetical protein
MTDERDTTNEEPPPEPVTDPPEPNITLTPEPEEFREGSGSEHR